MSGDVVAGIVALLCALLLVGRGVLARQRGGASVARYASIWAAIFIALFGLAMLMSRSQ